MFSSWSEGVNEEHFRRVGESNNANPVFRENKNKIIPQKIKLYWQ
jgi:hypothetical protein